MNSGKIFALMAALEAVAGLANSALYGYGLYPLTVDVYPGFSYIIGSLILILPLSIAM